MLDLKIITPLDSYGNKKQKVLVNCNQITNVEKTDDADIYKITWLPQNSMLISKEDAESILKVKEQIETVPENQPEYAGNKLRLSDRAIIIPEINAIYDSGLFVEKSESEDIYVIKDINIPDYALVISREQMKALASALIYHLIENKFPAIINNHVAFWDEPEKMKMEESKGVWNV